MAVIGFLRLTENFMVSGGRGPVEYTRGQLIPLHEYEYNRYDLLIREKIVEFLDKDKKPSTYEEISKLFYKPEPIQRPLIANKVKPLKKSSKLNK